MFLSIIFIWPCDLDLRPFDLGDVWWIKFRVFTGSTTCTGNAKLNSRDLPIFSILKLSVPELCDSIWSYYLHLERSLRMRRVTWPITGVKMIHIFEIPEPNLPIHFVTFTVLRRRLSHVIGKNSVFRLLTSHAQYHVTYPQGIPQNHT